MRCEPPSAGFVADRKPAHPGVHQVRWAFQQPIAGTAAVFLRQILIAKVLVQDRFGFDDRRVVEGGHPFGVYALRDLHDQTLCRNVIRPRVRSYGETSSVTRSPAMIRIRKRRILPAVVASTS